jgi:hypothetical protein
LPWQARAAADLPKVPEFGPEKRVPGETVALLCDATAVIRYLVGH